MAQALNRYLTDLREMNFLLFEQFRLQDLLGKAPFEAWGQDEVKLVLDEVARFAAEVSGPINAIGDQVGCKLIDGQVFTPPGFKEAWQKLREAGWTQLSASVDHGGQGAPITLQHLANEILSGSNTSFQLTAGLTKGAAELVESFGTDAQRALYCERMISGQWGGTMCLTEPQAGSDVGDCKTSAVKKPDGSFAIKGTKIFISGGDHDLTENNIHLVLARIEGAAAGTKGLSLFVVPKIRVNADGTLAGPNDVKVASIEHKMGINGSPTCVLNFGEDDACQGFLCGTAEHQGMRQMFQLMNDARILVGNQGVAAASSAYLNALAYAKERRQGAPLHDKNPDAPRALIIEHPDVRRMLLDMKAKVEGIRALGVYMTGCQDRIKTLSKDDPEAAFLQGQVDLMVPLYKAYGTDQGFQVCATAIQTYGGAGYLKDHPVEQNCRDAKIFAIYEGTNHIQALDLVGRKLRINNGQLAHNFAGEVNKLIQANAKHPRLGAAIGELASALAAGSKMLEQLGAWAKEGKLDMAPLAANRVLEGMSELAVGWLLLQGAVLSIEQADKLPASHPDRAFYEGKVCAAIFFAHNVLPGVAMKMKTMQSGDRSALEIPVDAF